MKHITIPLLLLISLSYNYAIAVTSSVTVRIIRQYRFDPPIETHLIEVVPSVQSLIKCAMICDRHIICRTADYHIVTKECRLPGDFVDSWYVYIWCK